MHDVRVLLPAAAIAFISRLERPGGAVVWPSGPDGAPANTSVAKRHGTAGFAQRLGNCRCCLDP